LLCGKLGFKQIKSLQYINLFFHPPHPQSSPEILKNPENPPEKFTFKTPLQKLNTPMISLHPCLRILEVYLVSECVLNYVIYFKNNNKNTS